jgi:hypothetical protein
MYEKRYKKLIIEIKNKIYDHVFNNNHLNDILLKAKNMKYY